MENNYLFVNKIILYILIIQMDQFPFNIDPRSLTEQIMDIETK